jgi:hypothetical protein
MGKKIKKQKENNKNKKNLNLNISLITRTIKQKIESKNKKDLLKANTSIIFRINENLVNQEEFEKQYYKKYLYFIKEEFNHKVIIMFFNYLSSSTVIPIPFKNNRYFIKDFLKVIIDLLMNEIEFVTVTLIFDAMGWVREGTDPWRYIYYICLLAKKKLSSNDIFSNILQILDKNNIGFQDSFFNWEKNIKGLGKIGINETNKRFRELLKPIYTNESHQKYIDYNEIVNKILLMSNKKDIDIIGKKIEINPKKQNENSNSNILLKNSLISNINSLMPISPKAMKTGPILYNPVDSPFKDIQPTKLDIKKDNSFLSSKFFDLSRDDSRNNSFFFSSFDGEPGRLPSMRINNKSNMNI